MPKRGGLKSAGKRQESATFLQRSFFDVAVQFFVCCSAAFGPNDFRTAEKTMLRCSSCSAALRKLQCNFRFRLWHVAGVGFRGVRFRTRFVALPYIGNSRITFHHFIFRELFLVIISSWFTSKNSGRIISRNLSDLHLLPHLFFASDIRNHYIRKFWGNVIFVKISCPLHQNILGELIM